MRIVSMVVLMLALAACKQTDDSSVEGFAETLPLVADRPTFVFFYTDG